jgi:hypothetical protein
MGLNWRFVSLGNKFPRKLTPAEERDYPRFKKSWDQVLDDLDRETFQLDARDGSIVIMTFHEKHWIRNDGRLQSNAPNPKYPGVVVRFDVPSEDRSKWVPMSFECDQFTTWKANVQAIAGALEALRKVDRYGVSSRGKDKAHYEGYKALPSAEGKTSTREYAAEILSTHSGIAVKEILVSDTARASAFRKAVQKVHPDSGGDIEDFVRLTEANKILQAITEAAHG